MSGDDSDFRLDQQQRLIDAMSQVSDPKAEYARDLLLQTQLLYDDLLDRFSSDSDAIILTRPALRSLLRSFGDALTHQQAEWLDRWVRLKNDS